MIFTKKDIERIVLEALQKEFLLEIRTVSEKRGRLSPKERLQAKEIFRFYREGGYSPSHSVRWDKAFLGGSVEAPTALDPGAGPESRPKMTAAQKGLERLIATDPKELNEIVRKLRSGEALRVSPGQNWDKKAKLYNLLELPYYRGDKLILPKGVSSDWTQVMRNEKANILELLAIDLEAGGAGTRVGSPIGPEVEAHIERTQAAGLEAEAEKLKGKRHGATDSTENFKRIKVI